MKKILTLLLLMTTLTASAQKIDTHHKKDLHSDVVFLDFNGNGKVDDGELRGGKIDVHLDYKHFGRFGNYLNIEFIASSKSKEARLSARYEGVNIEKKRKDYIVTKDGKVVFSTGNLKGYKRVICIHDLASYRLLLVRELK